MKVLSTVLSLILAWQIMFCSCAALAFPLSFIPAPDEQLSGLNLDLPAQSIGPLLLQGGLVSIYGRDVVVSAVPDWLFDKQQVLSGVLIHSALEATGAITTIGGLVYFIKGDWLTGLGLVTVQDVIYTNNGEAFSGQIGGYTSDGIDVLLKEGGRIKVSF